MAEVIVDEADLAVNGGSRLALVDNLKIIVILDPNVVTIMQDGGGNNVLETSPLNDGGEDADLQAFPIQHEGGEDTV